MTDRDLPPLNALRAFEATARLESVSRAAQELHVTHGAVSRQLHALEEVLGRPLLVRHGRGIALTAAGLQLRDSAVTAFGQLREDWAALRQDAQTQPFVLGCPSSLLARWVIPRLDRLGRDLPGFTLHLSAQEEPFSPTLAGLDAALMLASAPFPPGWRVHALAAERIGPVLSPRYAGYATLKDQPATRLQGEPLLHTASRPQAWPEWATGVGLDVERLRLGQGFEHLYYLLEAAIAGLGVAIAPEPLVADDVAAGRLVAPWGFTQTSADWILAVPQRAIDTRSAALVAWLRNELETHK
jgi:DNA-binding transcriptional LysR family regulator